MARHNERHYYVNACPTCQINKGLVASTLPVLQYPIPTWPWERVHVDLIGPLSLSLEGNRYILACIDAFSRYCELVLLPNKTTQHVAKALKERVLDRYGATEVLVSDNGLEFNNKILEQLCTFYQIKKCNILPYHPASNGLVERLNRKIVAQIKSILNSNSDVWDECLSDVQGSINSAYHRSLGDTPFFVLHGWDKRLPHDNLSSGVGPQSDDFLKDRLAVAQGIHQRVHSNLCTATEDYTNKANRSVKERSLSVGQLVLLTAHKISHKLEPKFWGPYRIIQHVKGHRYKIRHVDTGVVREEHGDHLKGFVGTVQNGGTDEYVDSSGPSQNVASQQGGNVVNDVSTSLPTNPRQTHHYNLRPR